jgi:hypothetical protein
MCTLLLPTSPTAYYMVLLRYTEGERGESRVEILIGDGPRGDFAGGAVTCCADTISRHNTASHTETVCSI